ncbi:uncharacterized protein MELLADRAFT_124297 [Melampsora larici-populina 98AG31]|uniref:Secreted protein n=1 Tax=Melampsora larici-populina (strain 98AG31 / pathotype 3-4-7) TaxID=747676 RepID=F4RUQ5_MELLP|nr:uncharacterized protein MELLADRAFT_124297 [Melampsora larici-populina 98AG31]EGG03738.1 secreted protein [Melampsora larici-populina 98AG31]
MIIKIASPFVVVSLSLLGVIGLMPSVVVVSARRGCVPRCGGGESRCMNDLKRPMQVGSPICVMDRVVGNTQKWKPLCERGSVERCPFNGDLPTCDTC